MQLVAKVSPVRAVTWTMGRAVFTFNENKISYGYQQRASNRWEGLLTKSVDMRRVAVCWIV